MTPTFTVYLIGPLVDTLRSRHPGITVDVREMTQDHIEASLLADELDLGIAFEGAHQAGIAATALFTEHLSLVVSADGDEVRGDRPLPVRELADRQLALLSGDFATRGHIDDYLAAHRVEPTVAVEANSILALTEIVRRSSLLATVLPDAIADDHPHLRPVPLDPPLPTRTAVLLRRESAYESAAARAFARLARGLVEDRGYRQA